MRRIRYNQISLWGFITRGAYTASSAEIQVEHVFATSSLHSFINIYHSLLQWFTLFLNPRLILYAEEMDSLPRHIAT